MGVLDRKITQYVSYKKTDVEGVSDFLKKKVGEKYKVVFKQKGNVAKQMLSGEKEDNVFVEKNAYHRIRIELTHVPANQTEAGKEEWLFHILRAELSGFLRVLDRETGMIGSFIIRLIYGNAEEFYSDVFEALHEEYALEERELNVGVSALFNKKK
ncbi:MAG: hypothetical protein CSA95_07380 [Bacteroidetes bacterium]|nr:MAG: hypothetical protein CSA95_07380 [Bacteroidota bacterium]PIE88293.1 MAG: hypothetical protein CSA04_02650 [Bacteroidota bacterium]